MDIESEITKTIVGLTSLYLLISSNYLGELYGCKLQTVLKNNMAVKHFVGLLTTFFAISLSNPGFFAESITRSFLTSIAIYILFILSTKTNITVTILILILLTIVYILETMKRKYNYDDESSKAQLQTLLRYQTYICIGIVLLILGGFVYYYLEKRFEYQKNFNTLTFIFGNPFCKNKTPDGFVTNIFNSFAKN
jgi:hypothetical protein